MNALVVSPETGYLESNNIRAFDSEKKQLFFQMCNQFRDKNQGKWPNFGSVCKAIGIHLVTLERHLKNDPKFAEEFRELTLSGKYEAEADMFEMRKKNPMFMFGWLRKYFPEEYNPDHKVTVDHNINVLQSLINKAKDNTEVIDTEAL